jgi:Alginate lyase
MALQTEVAPAARTVTLVALDTPATEQAPTEQLSAVDPAAVAAAATRGGNAPAPQPRPAAPAPAAAKPAPPAPAPPPSAPPAPPATDEQQGSEGDQGRDGEDADRDRTSNSDDSGSSSDENEDGDGSKSDSDSNADNGNGSSDGRDSGSDGDSDGNSGSSSSSSGESGSSSSDSDSGGSTSADDESDRDSNGSTTDNETSESGSRSTSGDGSADTAGTSFDPRISPGLPNGSSNAGGASGSPSQVIDTKDWYLTLPTGKEGDPDIVEGSALARYHSNFFQLTPRKDGVVFTAGTGGATTSGSHYPRSELREMFGSEKASWDGRKGRHTMDIVQAITATPKEKPDVIAGQIHGTSDDLMQIHLSGNLLRVKYADGQKFVDLDPNYRLGTMFAVRIESAGGRVKVWYNGQQKADLPISSSTSYFKAGVYTNSNPSKGDKAGEGQVVIRSLAVRHD